MVAQPQTVSLPPLQLLADEVIALLMTTFSAKLSLIQLTQKYNTCFRPDLPQVSKEQLLEAIKKLPNFKVHFVLLSMCEHLRLLHVLYVLVVATTVYTYTYMPKSILSDSLHVPVYEQKPSCSF